MMRRILKNLLKVFVVLLVVFLEVPLSTFVVFVVFVLSVALF